MKEQVSAMMDDALDDDGCERCARQLKEDAALRDTWELYHLIGDALRGHAAPQIVAGVRARLAAEPTVLAPRRSRRAESPRRWYPLAAAASVAAVALVAWMSLPLFERAPGAGPVATTAAVTAPAPAVVPVAQGVGDYLLAHQRFSPSIATGGLAPYIRTVAEESGAR
jgi:sigma-E factor negative regulatory protein RseA